MPCSAGRDLKQMLANAIHEMAAASEAMSNRDVSLELRERRLFYAKENHAWASTALYAHLETCSVCRTRQQTINHHTKPGHPSHNPKHA
jgi:hypothetical protein